MINEEGVFDDEKDVLNDETFGDGEDYTWDGTDQSESLFDFGQPSLNLEEKHTTQRETIRLPTHPSFPYGDYEDQEGGYTNVEESISRLVLDEDENESIEDERDRIIKASHRSLMPPQVITRNLNWFTEKDTGSSFFSSSIWSMHPTEVLQGTSQNNQQRPVVNQSQPAPYRPPPGLEEKRSCFRTLQDIEDELHLTSTPATGVNQLTAPAASGFPQVADENLRPILPMHSANTSGVSGLAQDASSMLHGLGRGIQNRAPVPPPGMQGPSAFHQGNHRMPFLLDRNARDDRDMTAYGIPRPPPVSVFDSGSRNVRAGFARPFPPDAMMGGGPMMRMPHGNMRPPRPHQGQTPPGMARPQQYQRSNMDFGDRRSTGYTQNRTKYPSGDFNGSRDKFAGLMTDQDKQRLKNIQILQLQGDHPYTTDYYYQMKLYGKDADATRLRKIFPLKAGGPRKNKYQPALFENALGKLQTVSALAPKRVMDTVLRVATTSTHARNSRLRLWQEIEKVYLLYLPCRELALRRRIPYNVNDEKEESLACSKILRALEKQGDNLFHWLVCRKGRELFIKIVEVFLEFPKRILEQPAYTVLANMLKYSTVRSMRRMESSPGFEQHCHFLRGVIRSADFFPTDLLLQSFHIDLWRTCFGCTMGLAILDRAAEFKLYVLMHEEGKFDPSKLDEHIGPRPDRMFQSNSTSVAPGFDRFESILRALLAFDMLELGTPLQYFVAPEQVEELKSSPPVFVPAGKCVEDLMVYCDDHYRGVAVFLERLRLVYDELKRRSFVYKLAIWDLK